MTSANKSIVVAMYGYDDPELSSVLQSAMKDEKIYVQMSLDSAKREESPSALCWPGDDGDRAWRWWQEGHVARDQVPLRRAAMGQWTHMPKCV